MVEYQKGDICPENEYGKAKDEKQAKRWPVTLRANGTAKYPFAYEPVAYKSKVLIPHWDRIQWIELAFQHLENGHSLRETAAWLGDKTGKTISYNGLNNLWRKQKGRKQTPRSKKLKEARKAREEKLTPEDKQERDINRKVGAERRRITNALKRLQNLDKKKGNTPSPVMEVEPVASSKGFVATSDTLIEEPQADIIFQPNPGPQTDFLAATEMEILYGGPLTLDTRVVTVNGYTPIGELSVGDIVFTPEGKQTAVVDIPFEGTEESYEITFDDGTKITASAGHRWLVSTGDWRKTNTPYRERKTYELFKEFKLPNGRARFGVPYTAPLQWPERSHVIHPYVMGALLGDGSFSKGCPSMTSIDPEIKGYIQRHLPDTHYLWETPSSIQGRIRRMGKSGTHRFTPDIFLDEIKRLGLYGTYSDTKFIPSEYLHDSVMNRIHLLRGMMDTDGTVRSTKHNRRGAECKYTTISPTLANDFIYLADSLGYRVTYHTEERPSQTPIYRIYLAGPINPFNLVRKYERVNEFNRHYRHRMIVDVVAVGTCKVRCITVDDPSHLFLTERFIPTFNSAGGGKTYAMLADPLRYFGNPNFNGILFRRTNDELREIIWKAQELYPKAYPGAKWSEKKSQWVFPSGARIWFTYLERDEDVLRYQGMAFCVAEGTPIRMGDGTFKPVEEIRTNDLVDTLEGPKAVTFTHASQTKYSVRVSVYSLDGRLVSSQIQPANHPIALLSSKPFERLSDLYRSIDTLRSSPLQWLSPETLQSGHQESQEGCAFLEDDRTDSIAYEDGSLETSQPQQSIYLGVLHEPSLQSILGRGAIRCHTSYKSSSLSSDLDQETSEIQTGLLLHDGFARSQTDRSTLQTPSYEDADGALDREGYEGCRYGYPSCHGLGDERLPLVREADQYLVLRQDDAEELDRIYRLYGETDCTPLRIRSRLSWYNHPYTQEPRDLATPLELCIVRVEPIENPFQKVIDLTVADVNHYISYGGIINRNCWIGFDELTQYPTPFAFNYMRSRLRTTDPTLPLCLRCTTNPGGPGHGWVKKMFIDPAPPNMTFAATDLDTGQPLVFPEGHPKAGKPLFYRRFIPAKLFDNPYLSSDGVYEANLLSLPENQRRQLLEGDWNVADGAAFSEFREHIHTCDPFDIPPEWTRFRSCDFGYSSNSAVHWYAIDPSFDTLYVYRELYTSKLTAAELAAEILSYEAGEKIYYGVLDSSSWHKRGHTGPSIAEEMIRVGCRWRPADRTAGSRIAGKNRLHQLLRVDPVTEKPGIIFFNTCRQIIADLPVIPSDPKGSEDIDVRYASDHTYDSIRYGIMSRPRSYFDFDTGSTKIRNWQPADPVFGY